MVFLVPPLLPMAKTTTKTSQITQATLQVLQDTSWLVRTALGYTPGILSLLMIHYLV